MKSIVKLYVLLLFVATIALVPVAECKTESSDITIANIDAHIEVNPDKYEYRYGEFGYINVKIENYVFPDIGWSSYCVRIPDDVEYIGIVQGTEPKKVYISSEDNSVLLPKLGFICGPCTTLYWNDVNTFNYKENIKIKVRYNCKGKYSIMGKDHAMDSITGIPSWDSDTCKVTVT
jgi:hypothetical protein